MKSYLITGGCGFLGRNIVQLLCEGTNPDQVSRLVLFDLRVTPQHRAELSNMCQGAGIELELVEGDITCMGHVNAAMHDVDVVIHTAALIDFRGLIDRKILWHINVDGTQNVIDACLRHNVQYLVYTSSLEVVCPNQYGDDFIQGDENTPYKGEPIGKYGRSKKAAEQLVTSSNGYKLANHKSLRSVALRMAGVYGENDPFIGTMLDGNRKSKKIRMINTKPTTRMYAANAAWCHLLAAHKLQSEEGEKLSGESYFVRDDSPDLPFEQTNMQFIAHRGYQTQPVRIPFVLIYALTWLVTCLYQLMHLFGMRKEPKITSLTLRMVSCEFTTSDRKFRRRFGYAPLHTWEASRDRMRRFVDRYLDGDDKKSK